MSMTRRRKLYENTNTLLQTTRSATTSRTFLRKLNRRNEKLDEFISVMKDVVSDEDLPRSKSLCPTITQCSMNQKDIVNEIQRRGKEEKGGKQELLKIEEIIDRVVRRRGAINFCNFYIKKNKNLHITQAVLCLFFLLFRFYTESNISAHNPIFLLTF
ncbi:hypothetical protein CAEBREN_01055 [Caenorhabditis brenneri]|uniref:Uncharacterized protein n=1 Tax=Caenorhabditis brenneri TaxID=135651 RepID=G0P520_CAEBE|nr:hypothetical protein CAEBREN_01055 [Caenorhabditis brenneri]